MYDCLFNNTETKNRNEDICKGTLDIEFERGWSVGLGATLRVGHTEKFKKIQFRGLFREKPILSYCLASNVLKPTKFNQNR